MVRDSNYVNGKKQAYLELITTKKKERLCQPTYINLTQ